MKKNRLFSLILLVTMFFSLYTQSGVAAEDSVAAFDVTGFEYCDASGNAINILTANGVVKATATIDRISGTSGATLMLMAYDNGKLIELSSDVADFTGDNSDDVSASVTMPADVSKVKVMAYLWDSALGMEPISAGAVFGTDNADIISALIGGVNVSAFDENNAATVVLPASASDEPAVKAVCADLSTKVVPTYGENTVTLTATSHDGTEKVYTVNYTREEAKLSDVSYTSDATYTETSTEPIKFARVNPNLDAELFYDDATSAYTKTIKDVYNVTLTDMHTVVTPHVSNRYPYWFLFEVPEKFIGMNSIIVPYNNDTVYAGNDTVTFTTNKSVRFYVSSTAAWKDGDATDLGSFTFKASRGGDSEATTTSYADMKSTADGQAFATNMYSYDVAVAEGGAPVTTTIKVRSAGTWVFPNIYYEFIDNSELDTPPVVEPEEPTPGEPEEPTPDEPEEPVVSDVTDVKYYYNASLSNIADKTPVVLEDRITMRKPSTDLTADTSKKPAEVIGSATKDNILAHATYGWQDRYWSIFWDVPQELVGYHYIPGDIYGDGGTAASGTYAVYELTINQNMQVLFPGASNRCTLVCTTDSDETATAAPITYTGDFTLLNMGDSNYNNDTLATSIASKKTFSGGSVLYAANLTVPDDAETATWRIEARVGGDWFPPFLMYKLASEIDPSTIPLVVTATVNGADYAWSQTAVNAKYTKDTNEFNFDGTTPNPTYNKYFLGDAVVWSAENSRYEGKGGAAVWVTHANRLDTSGYTYIHKLPEEVAGAKMGCWVYDNHGNNADGSNVSTMTITINRDATLYFDTTDDYATTSGATRLDSGISTLNAGNYYNCTQVFTLDDPTVAGNTNFHEGRLFKLTMDVPAGQESATFEIPLAWNNGNMPLVFIK